MSDISKIQTNGETYDVKDATARSNLDGLATNMDGIRNMAQEAQETADSKVSSVNIGTVTTGDSPSVTNSGTDKDVTLDFVFPQGGGGGVEFEVGSLAAGSQYQFTEACLGLFFINDPNTEIIYYDGAKMNYISNGVYCMQVSDDTFLYMNSSTTCRYVLIKG